MASEIAKKVFKGVYDEDPKAFADAFKSGVDDKIKSKIDDYQKNEIIDKLNNPTAEVEDIENVDDEGELETEEDED